MSQNEIDFGNSDPSGDQLLDTLLPGFQENFQTTNIGSSRPSYAQIGTIWVDNTTSPWVLKMFMGTDDIVLGNLNPSTLVFTPSDVVGAGALMDNELTSLTGVKTLTVPDNTVITAFAKTLVAAATAAAARAELDVYSKSETDDKVARNILHVQHQEPRGSNGGSANNGVYNLRPLTTVLKNTISGASLDTGDSEITLPAGIYDVTAMSTVYGITGHFLRLYDVDNATQLLRSVNRDERSSTPTAGYAHLRGEIVLASETTLRFDHYTVGAQATTGLGQAVDVVDQVEVYADVIIKKEE